MPNLYKTTHIISEQEAKEEIKDFIYLIQGKHILDEQAGELLNEYKGYLNKDHISLFTFIHARYGNPD